MTAALAAPLAPSAAAIAAMMAAKAYGHPQSVQVDPHHSREHPEGK